MIVEPEPIQQRALRYLPPIMSLLLAALQERVTAPGGSRHPFSTVSSGCDTPSDASLTRFSDGDRFWEELRFSVPIHSENSPASSRLLFLIGKAGISRNCYYEGSHSLRLAQSTPGGD